jgi:hypothetical protein
MHDPIHRYTKALTEHTSAIAEKTVYNLESRIGGSNAFRIDRTPEFDSRIRHAEKELEEALAILLSSEPKKEIETTKTHLIFGKNTSILSNELRTRIQSESDNSIIQTIDATGSVAVLHRSNGPTALARARNLETALETIQAAPTSKVDSIYIFGIEQLWTRADREEKQKLHTILKSTPIRITLLWNQDACHDPRYEREIRAIIDLLHGRISDAS